ncbi:hypothetical protein ABIE53_001092 [Burkholderia sp. OAS925]|jgi:hypothetical protein|uniref:hypothetical protein n=1 Tax=Paraburkholderia sp. OAS925 TaxID=2663827 RepID=UPI00178AE58F
MNCSQLVSQPISTDLLSLLEPLIDKGDATRNSAGWQQALSRVHGMILLNASK